MNRRDVIGVAGSIAGAVGAAGATQAVATAPRPSPAKRAPIQVIAKDGVKLFHLDWGSGDPVLFSSNWGMTSEMWQYQMAPFSRQGLRCVAYDRRGTGFSARPSGGYDIDTLADDLAAVIDQLDLQKATLVGHSMAGGEIVRYLTRYGTGRVARIVLVAPTTPFLLKTADNPDGVSMADNDAMRAAWCTDYPKWVAENVAPYFADGVSREMMAWVASMAMQCSIRTAIELSHTWSETDFRGEMRKLDVPTLVIQGDKDTLPMELTGRKTAALIPGAVFKIYKGEAHGLMFTSTKRFNADLLAFMGR